MACFCVIYQVTFLQKVNFVNWYLLEVHFEKQTSNSCLFSDKAWIHLHG